MIKVGDCMLTNFIEMLNKAKLKKYAVPHFNINNLEWAKFILEECQNQKIPVILGVSESAAKYMGGYQTIVGMIKGLIKDLNITIPVCLHLDHGKSFEECKKAIDSGFSSVMIDASNLSLEENIKITKKVVNYAHNKRVSVEAEVGRIGEYSEKTNSEMIAKVDDCIEIYEKTKIDALAPALGSVHGFYKKEPNLNFEVMQEISNKLPIPIVLHGGSGIPNEQIKKSIQCGINKINVNTELQASWSNSVREFLKNNKDVYDPRKIICSGENAIKKIIRENIKLFGTNKEK